MINARSNSMLNNGSVREVPVDVYHEKYNHNEHKQTKKQRTAHTNMTE